MGSFLLRRLFSLVPVLWVMATVVWVVMFVLPGDPARMIAGRTADEPTLQEVRRQLGLDQPAWKQYGLYLTRLARGDLGRSYLQDRPVARILGERAWPSIFLSLSAIGLALAVGVIGGTASAVRPGRSLDRGVFLASLAGIAIPVFWLGIMLRLIFSSWLHLLPVRGYTRGDAAAARLFGLDLLPMPDPEHLILPCLTLAAFSAGYFIRVVRASLLEVQGEEFLRTARAKGLSRRTALIRHALRHAMVPLATVAGVQLAGLMGGAIATEMIFDWPGLGTALLQGISMRDMPVVSGVVMLLTVLFVIVNLGVDVLYAWLDPRIRTS
ncbi:MAG: ABC transporter permease [Acidobacteriota bacterium]|jgi:ABC-type dipeptide/oligopeptide/nickel transport system permease component